MKRSAINRAYRDALASFARHGWTLPPVPCWDITDFGLGDFAQFGLTLVTLAAEPEYCEKIMHARRGQTTPCHAHARKKEDIICRAGELGIRLWPIRPDGTRPPEDFLVRFDGQPRRVLPGSALPVPAGSRVTLPPGVWHEFSPMSPEAIIGEVSTANNDRNDNFFLNPEIGRFPGIEEDEPAAVRLVSDA
jgi:D-lyxose ketol-isomerase